MRHKAYTYYLLLVTAALLLCSQLVMAQKPAPVPAAPQADTTKKTALTDTTAKKTAATDTAGKNKYPFGKQLRLGIDLSAPVMSFAYKNRKAFEVAVDYAYKNENYLVAEVGYGSASYEYPDLSYKNSNPFIKLGFDKNLLYRGGKGDWDIGFFGLRACSAIINRGQGNYVITDSLWGNAPGTVAASKNFALWFELTAGVKVELLKNFFVGWTARGKILITQGFLKELPPAYIAGYGKGDKPSAATFNVYIAYALRWDKQNMKK